MKTFAFSVSTLAALMAGQVLAQGQTTPRPTPPTTQPGQRPGVVQPANPTTQPGQRPSTAPTTTTTQTGQDTNLQLSQHAAACLLIGNQEEIALSEFGVEHAQSDEVKEFAREMIKEHTKFVSKLRKFTPQQASFELNVKADEKAVVDNAAETAKKKPQDIVRGGEATAPKIATTTSASSGSMADQLLGMKRDKAHECLSITKKNLQEHQGEAFDQAFLGTQVAVHTSMLAELRAMKGKVSGEFAQLVTEGEESTQKHLDHAKDMMEKLASSSSAERPEPTREERPAPDRPRVREERGERDANPAPPAGERPRAPRNDGERPSREG
jgi:predicted outer membrane protein